LFLLQAFSLAAFNRDLWDVEQQAASAFVAISALIELQKCIEAQTRVASQQRIDHPGCARCLGILQAQHILLCIESNSFLVKLQLGSSLAGYRFLSARGKLDLHHPPQVRRTMVMGWSLGHP